MSEKDGGSPTKGDEGSPKKVATPEATATIEADDTAKLGDNETRVEIKSKEDGSPNRGDDEFRALSKAELMKYATDPFWVTLRWVLFILFWIAWIAMLIAAIVIIVLAPKCPTPAPKHWWQKAPIYEVYVKSFKDSSGDGVGDLNGIHEKLDYFESLGVGSLWLTPIYPSPMKDNGYDISNYVDIEPTFGTMEDFKKLLAGMKNKGLKLILDFVPNHSSDKHEWFQKSVKREDPYTDYYVWRDGKTGGPPNNWKSVFGAGVSAWTKNEERGQYYLHQFYPEQPDLNLRNELVVDELKRILSFWLDLGVDGFRIDAVSHFFEDPNFADETLKPGMSGDKYEDYDHSLTTNQPETIQLLKQFRDILDNKTAEDIYNPRIMMTETYLPVDQLVKYYGDEKEVATDDKSERSSVSQMPLNFGFISDLKTVEDLTATKVRESIETYLNGLPKWAWPNFQLGNHDVGRAASRFGSNLTDAMNMISMLLPGTPITYYGEEIGMVDGTVDTKDIRDKYRTPMQWSDEANAGFTKASTSWLPANPDYTTVNVNQQLKKSELGHTLNSHAAIYSYLANLRQNEAILFGSIEFINGTGAEENLFGYTRVKKGNPGTLVLVNFGNSEISIKLSEMKYIPERGTVQVRSVYKPEQHDEDSKSILFDSVKIKAKEGLVIAFVPKF